MGDDSEEVGVDTVGELLEDEYTRSILAETSNESLSAQELVDRCDASPPTIYRRINRLQELEMLDEDQRLDPDGHHYREFSARLDRVTIELSDGTYDVSVHRKETDAVERFTKLYEGLR